jgi:endonuclease/exonuclease/phosphatase family metal-dependent hydrolase
MNKPLKDEDNIGKQENPSQLVIRYGDEVEFILFASQGEERYLYYKEAVEDIRLYTITKSQEGDISSDGLLKYKWKIVDPTNPNAVGNPVKANDVVALYNIVSKAYLDAKSGRDEQYAPGEGLTFANQNNPQKDSAKWKIEKENQSDGQEVVEGDYLNLQTQWQNDDGECGYLKGETNPQELKQRVFSFGNGSRDTGCSWRVVKQKTILSEIEKKYQELGGLSGALGSPRTEEYDVPDGRMRDFEKGSIHHRTITARLSFVEQNMGLLPTKALGIVPLSFIYKGRERKKAIDSLVQNLLREPPDLVGLCEVFDDDEKNQIKSRLHDIYPHSLEGPASSSIYYNGGLLLLSKHQIVQTNQTIYSKGSGFDNLTNKGVLHARIQVPGHPTEYDVFLTHTQDAEAAAESPYHLKLQLTELANFIGAHRNQDAPTLLMGDLNVNGRDANFYNELLTRLNNPENLLPRRVVTYDNKGSFDGKNPSRPVDDPNRHIDGYSLDYFLVKRGKKFWSTYENTQVVVWQSSAGWDISDHYGIKTQQKEVNEIVVTLKP